MNRLLPSPVRSRLAGTRMTLMLACLLGLLAATTACSTQSSSRTAAVLEAGRLKADLLGVALLAGDARAGSFDAIDSIKDLRARIQQRIDRLREGDSTLGIAPPAKTQSAAIERVSADWRGLDDGLQRLLSKADLLIDIGDTAAEISSLVPQLQSLLDELARQQARGGAAGEQLYMLTRNLVLVERILRSTSDVLDGGAGAVSAADRLSRDASVLERSLVGLRDGDSNLGIKALTSGPARDTLDRAIQVHAQFAPLVQSLINESVEVFEVVETVEQIGLDVQGLVQTIDALAETY